MKKTCKNCRQCKISSIGKPGKDIDMIHCKSAYQCINYKYFEPKLVCEECGSLDILDTNIVGKYLCKTCDNVMWPKTMQIDNTNDNLQAKEDEVRHPNHYTSAIPGIEVIEITKHLNFCRGNVIKYVLRAGLKGSAEKEIQDLEKARQYIDFEIERLKNS